MIKVGFTGTRFGMSVAQYNSLKSLLGSIEWNHGVVELHHGDCVGADAEVHGLLEYQAMHRIVIHPPEKDEHRAFCRNYHEMRLPKSHFARNRDIVDEGDVLIATPLQMTHQPNGGTWYTYDYGMRRGRPIALVLRDGAISYDGAPWPSRPG